MKFAVISDIHGSYPALKAILNECREIGVDEYIFAGDYCISVPWPGEVVSTLMSMDNAHIVRGNEEVYLHQPESDDGQMEVSRWAVRQLSIEQRDWLDALPARLDFEAEGVGIHVTHASSIFIGQCEYKFGKTSYLHMRYGERYVTHEENLSYVQSMLLNDPEFRELAVNIPKGVYIFGHSHDQFFVEYEGRYFINPGSCGLPLDCIEFGFPYTVIEVENGIVTVDEHRISCDVEKLISMAKETTQFTEAHVWSEIIFHEWRTSREMIRFFLTNAEEYANSIGDPRRPFAKDTWEAAYLDWKAKIERGILSLEDDGIKG